MLGIILLIGISILLIGGVYKIIKLLREIRDMLFEFGQKLLENQRGENTGEITTD